MASTIETDVDTFTVVAQHLTPEAFAPFGVAILAEAHQRLPIELYEGTVDAYSIPVEADEPFEFLLNTMRYRPLRATHLERHMGMQQAFIPLGGQPFVACVAPPDAEIVDGVPAFESIRAFVVPGNAAAMMHRGTWHEPPFPLMAEQSIIVTSHQSLTRGLQEKSGIEGKKEIGKLDVDKRNILERTGKIVKIQLPN